MESKERHRWLDQPVSSLLPEPPILSDQMETAPVTAFSSAFSSHRYSVAFIDDYTRIWFSLKINFMPLLSLFNFILKEQI